MQRSGSQAIIDSRGGRLSGPIPQGVARTFSFLGGSLEAQVNAESAAVVSVVMMAAVMMSMMVVPTVV